MLLWKATLNKSSLMNGYEQTGFLLLIGSALTGQVPSSRGVSRTESQSQRNNPSVWSQHKNFTVTVSQDSSVHGYRNGQKAQRRKQANTCLPWVRDKRLTILESLMFCQKIFYLNIYTTIVHVYMKQCCTIDHIAISVSACAIISQQNVAILLNK